MCTKTSLPPSSLATKPKPLASSNHLTLPLTATAVAGSGAARRGGRGASEKDRCGPLYDARRIDFDDPRHLRALGAGADRHLELRARRHRFVAGSVQRVGVQEGVALSARQLDEPIALVGLEPFHDGVDRRAADRRRSAAAHRRPAETGVRPAAKPARGARLRLVGHRPVIVEPALARRPEILTLAHVTPNLRPINPLAFPPLQKTRPSHRPIKRILMIALVTRFDPVVKGKAPGLALLANPLKRNVLLRRHRAFARMAKSRPKPSLPGVKPGRIPSLPPASSKPARTSAVKFRRRADYKLIALCFNSLDHFARYFALCRK